ncbi:MAG: DUF3883 domain-containing protein [Anaeroplasmataceae bacterium]|nr:DUF3883 domain-containing protein [Anaeroplasmataceae bacterium]
MLLNFNDKLETWMKSDDYKGHLENEEKMIKELNKFLKKFTIEYISSMPIEVYVTGNGSKESFCYCVERKFKCYGDISGQTTAYQKFVIQWSNKYDNYIFGDHRTKNRRGFGSSVEEIYNNVRKELVNLIDATNKKDYDRIIKNPLNPLFKNKISYLYNSINQIPIYSEDDLNTILTIFDIPFDTREDRFLKRKKLFEFYKLNELDSKISTYMFMQFLYGWYGYRTVLRSSDKPTIELQEIKKYKLVDVEIEKVYSTIRTGNGTSKRMVYNSRNEESKRITGKKAQNIVKEYLIANKNKLGITEINCYCDGEKQDDGRGYDISYILTDGSEIYVEVKGTKIDWNNQVYFEMSANEYSVMKAHPDNYYIFFVNDVNRGNEIKRILAKDIYGEEPVKYRIHFESSIK